MYGLEYLTELFCMCYKNLWASMANPFQSNVVTGMGNIGRRARANDCFRLQWLIA